MKPVKPVRSGQDSTGRSDDARGRVACKSGYLNQSGCLLGKCVETEFSPSPNVLGLDVLGMVEAGGTQRDIGEVGKQVEGMHSERERPGLVVEVSLCVCVSVCMCVCVRVCVCMSAPSPVSPPPPPSPCENDELTNFAVVLVARPHPPVKIDPSANLHSNAKRKPWALAPQHLLHTLAHGNHRQFVGHSDRTELRWSLGALEGGGGNLILEETRAVKLAGWSIPRGPGGPCSSLMFRLAGEGTSKVARIT